MSVLSKANLIDPVLVADLITKVGEHSSIANLATHTPLSFNGNKEFVFSMDSDVDVVAENGKKTHGGVSMTPVIISPIKVEYGARVSEEFVYSAEDTKINYLKAFNEGFAKKVARGLDLMAIHGVNPRTKTASNVINGNCLYTKAADQKTEIPASKGDPEKAIETAIGQLRTEGYLPTGMALSPSFASTLASITVNGVRQFPELGWGNKAASLRGLPVDVNTTISAVTDNKLLAVVGDFANMFHWGYAKDVPLEVIRYGDPDGSGQDLKNYNQVYIRAELYLGWGILDPKAFALITHA